MPEIETIVCPENGKIEWRAFTKALLLGPLCGTIASIFAAFIPLYAVAIMTEEEYYLYYLLVPVYGIIFGAPFYILFGGPAFVLTIKYGPRSVWVFALAGFLSNIFTPALAYLWTVMSTTDDLAELYLDTLAFSFPCAAIYGWGFGSVYLHLTKGQTQ